MYREKMDIMRDTLVTLGLSETSKEQVLRYYEYLWSRHRQLDTETTFLEGLPISLQTPIKMEMHHDAINQCYLFQKCDEAVLANRVQCSQSSMAMALRFQQAIINTACENSTMLRKIMAIVKYHGASQPP